MANKAVVLGANYYIGLSIIRCLAAEGVVVAAVDYAKEGAYAFHSRYCAETLIAPHYQKDPQGLLDFLIDYARRQDSPPLLLPSADPYVEFLDDYLPILRDYYLIPQTEQGLYTKAMDKGTLHQLAVQHGVAVPEIVEVNDENFLQKVEQMIKYPCLVKPVDSPLFVAKFRKKLFKVFTQEDMLEKIKMAADANVEVVVQRMIPGFDDHMYTYDAYLNQESQVTHWTTFQKLRQFPINFGASVYTHHQYVPELHEIGAKFLEGIGWKGFAEIEFKKDAETGRFYLIEINVRTTNFNHLIYRIGLNMPYLAYRELTGSPVEPQAITHDVNRVFWYAYEDLLAVRDYIRAGQLSAGQVLRSYFRPKAHAIWSWKDPKPAFVFAGKILGRVWSKVLGRNKGKGAQMKG